ncbi:DUF6114 domain-containing protein [Actinomadura sp. WAC 06369]|uniref:DUF6114 domain-containing protein n=1 Tax=Actinomadura sp. WAC 06369 TaxID=2203193 RepID=UPI000F7B85BD|nr:DUF6114 domain-containing protein [Actinomadura sp. WAC 06369]RSN68900.1 hypothetical protein DMH08_09675 [Actinomadura sp. WAC 06369]
MLLSRLPAGRRAAAAWCARRPFAAGLLVAAAGAEILLVPVAGTGLIVHTGVGGYAAFLLGLFLAALGAALWFAPEQRVPVALLTVLAALAAFVLTNLGGFLVGTLAAITGASLAFAWTPPADDGRPGRRPRGARGRAVRPPRRRAPPGR